MTWQVAARVAVSHFSLFATPTSPVVRRFFNGIFFNGEMDNSSDPTNPEDIGGNTVAARGRWVHTHATIRFALILKQTHAAGGRTHGKKRSRSIVHRSLPRESTNHTFLYPPVGSRSRMSHVMETPVICFPTQVMTIIPTFMQITSWFPFLFFPTNTGIPKSRS